MDRPYEPISCQVHDRMLALATLKQECELEVVSTDGEAQRLRGVIEDVYSRGGAEWLRLVGGRTFRLDDILTLDGRPILSG